MPGRRDLPVSRRQAIEWGLGGALGAVLTPWLAACGIDDPGQEMRATTPKTLAELAALRPAVKAVNRFALDLHRTLATGASGNLVFGPTAIAGALALAWRGADGRTKSELDAVLHAPDGSMAANAFVTLDQLVRERTGDRSNERRTGKVKVSMPRSVWAPRGTEFDEAFLGRLASELDAGVQVIDFRSNAEAAREAINSWAAQQTDELVTELVAAGGITEASQLVCASAARISAPWDTELPRELTHPGPFRLLDGSTREVATMAMPSTGAIRCGTYDAHDGSGPADVIEVPYLGDQLSLVLLVPRGDLAPFEAGLEPDVLQASIQSLEPGAYEIRVPRFSLRHSVELSAALGALGAPSVTDPATADFAKLSGAEHLCVSAAFHQATFAVDEEGSSGGQAATVVRSGSPRPAPDRAVAVDRPFAFVVRDRQTDLLLLVGHVTDPGGA